jgi:hypothetical protein
MNIRSGLDLHTEFHIYEPRSVNTVQIACGEFLGTYKTISPYKNFVRSENVKLNQNDGRQPVKLGNSQKGTATHKDNQVHVTFSSNRIT